MAAPQEVALAMRRVVDDVRAMVVSASLHAANLMIYKTRTQKAQQAHKAAGEAAKFESQSDSIALQLPEDLAFHLKWLAWNAAWHAANYLAENTADAASALRAFEKHAKRTEELLPAELADNFKWMAWNAAWHAANTRSNLLDDAEEDRKLFEKHAAALAPWRLRSWCKTPPRPDPPFRGVNLVRFARSHLAPRMPTPTCDVHAQPVSPANVLAFRVRREVCCSANGGCNTNCSRPTQLRLMRCSPHSPPPEMWRRARGWGREWVSPHHPPRLTSLCRLPCSFGWRKRRGQKPLRNTETRGSPSASCRK